MFIKKSPFILIGMIFIFVAGFTADSNADDHWPDNAVHNFLDEAVQAGLLKQWTTLFFCETRPGVIDGFAGDGFEELQGMGERSRIYAHEDGRWFYRLKYGELDCIGDWGFIIKEKLT